jgi:predicted RND superfamily exporter protein
MDRIRIFADVSIRRGCGFAFIAICTTMFAMSINMALAMKAGAALTLLTAAVLALKGLRARRRHYRKTETWLLVENDHGIPEHRLQDVFGRILEERYFWHARVITGVAVALWVVGMLLRPPA